ncbi:hypothetical protein PLESTM_000306400 [Pleodorina starrii]|nr:hypothetical protein PLESTM_000306400 [Pleodorina starrii]
MTLPRAAFLPAAANSRVLLQKKRKPPPPPPPPPPQEQQQQACCEDCWSFGQSARISDCYLSCAPCGAFGDVTCEPFDTEAGKLLGQIACQNAAAACSDNVISAYYSKCYSGSSKDLCTSQGTSYAKNGGLGCEPYTTGVSTCDASSYQDAFERAIGGLCSAVANGVVMNLP